jgi:hypothetical protein
MRLFWKRKRQAAPPAASASPPAAPASPPASPPAVKPELTDVQREKRACQVFARYGQEFGPKFALQAIIQNLSMPQARREFAQYQAARNSELATENAALRERLKALDPDGETTPATVHAAAPPPDTRPAGTPSPGQPAQVNGRPAILHKL